MFSKNLNYKLNLSGQTTIEFMILLSIGLSIILLIYIVGFNQYFVSFDTYSNSKVNTFLTELKESTSILSNLENGSFKKIIIDIPQTVDLTKSYFDNNVIILKFVDGSNIITFLDYPIQGELTNYGKQTIYLTKDGNKILFNTSYFEVIQDTIFNQDSNEIQFSLNNNFNKKLKIYLDVNFESNYLLSSSSLQSLDPFDLNEYSKKELIFKIQKESILENDLNFGTISFIAEFDDKNLTKTFFISLNSN
ncbi:MAG: hypothetical protein PHQ98_02420 [Candidatus ainarchaeum sp.]|nr:hypothetical protein [Candidatus ainarchaeum sp.]